MLGRLPVLNPIPKAQADVVGIAVSAYVADAYTDHPAELRGWRTAAELTDYPGCNLALIEPLRAAGYLLVQEAVGDQPIRCKVGPEGLKLFGLYKELT